MTNTDIANKIFDITGTDKEEINRIVTALVNFNSNKSLSVASRIEMAVTEYADKNDLCPECLNDKFESKRICGATLSGPEEWEYTCQKCGWTT